jgi:aspartyl-tRNA(Asn)/glutamyl-tRNA(Gln) amidotransferase subunit A
VTANLTGLPALALPAALDKQGLPLGLQVIGKALDEEGVFAVSAAIEQAANFRAKAAKWWF